MFSDQASRKAACGSSAARRWPRTVVRLPLYRQTAILEREGIEIERATRAIGLVTSPGG
jgi:hypothetical protein